MLVLTVMVHMLMCAPMGSRLLHEKKFHKSLFLHDDQLRNGLFLCKPELDDDGNLRDTLRGVLAADPNNLALLRKAKEPIKVHLFPPFRPHGDGTPRFARRLAR